MGRNAISQSLFCTRLVAMEKEIKYVGFYNLNGSEFSRVGAQSAINKMDYIISALEEIGYKVRVVSPSWFTDQAKKAPFTLKEKKNINKKSRVIFAPSLGTTLKIFRNVKIVIALFWLFFYLLFKTKKNEKILLYHSPWLVLPVLWAKKIRRFQLVLEVEEIYADVSSLHPYFDALEFKIFKAADIFLFSTELLAEKLANGKPNIVIYGSYATEEIALNSEIASHPIKLVYAGIIDSEKAGAFNAIEMAPFLNEDYEIRIIGFGEVEKLMKRIEEINTFSKCKIFYDGMKSGPDYIAYCQECSIGLSTQTMSGAYLNTSFPSKILSYLGMGLPVVSCHIDCVSKSSISDLVSYYYQDTPQAIAEAVCHVPTRDKNYQINRIKELHNEFKLGLKKNL